MFFTVIVAGFNSTWNSPFSDILTRNVLILIAGIILAKLSNPECAMLSSESEKHFPYRALSN